MTQHNYGFEGVSEPAPDLWGTPGERKAAWELHERLLTAFWWEDTPQGYDYWIAVHINLYHLANGSRAVTKAEVFASNNWK